VMILSRVFSSTACADVLDSKGTDFWLAFPMNYQYQELAVFVTGETGTTGTVSVPGLGWSSDFGVTPGFTTTVGLPNVELSASDSIENKGVHVTANDTVTVYGWNHADFSTDAYLSLPTEVLGTEYIILAYDNGGVITGTQFAVVGTENSTTVTIVPSITTDDHPAGAPYMITLDQGETYFLQNGVAGAEDLSGTVVTSDKPVAVFGSHRCANIPTGYHYCSHIVEQLPPIAVWGESFVTMPLATRSADTVRILGSVDGTMVTVNGSALTILNAGEFHEQTLSIPATITATAPVLVAQYSHGRDYDGVAADPFMMLIPPNEQFLTGYAVSTPGSGFTRNYINILAPDAAVGLITVDGTPVPAGSYTTIGSSGFSGVAYTVTLGTHNLDGPFPFGVSLYGFGNDDSYGYVGGVSSSAQTSLSLIKAVDDDTPNQGQVITYTIAITNGGGLATTNALISDTLPTGLTFVGPIALEPSGAGSIGTYPILAHGVTITAGESVTITFTAAVGSGQAGNTVITNTAFVTCTEVITPQTGSKAITVSDVTPPQIVATVPVSGATDVTILAPVIITFSEAISTASFTYTIVPDPGGWSEMWGNGDTVVTLSHTAFGGDTIHTITVTSAIDLADNLLSGIPYTWSFTTVRHSVYLPFVLRGF